MHVSEWKQPSAYRSSAWARDGRAQARAGHRLERDRVIAPSNYVFVMHVTPPTPAPRPYPDHMYIDMPTLVRSGGGIVFLISAFSLLLSWLTGFAMIAREIATLLAIGGIAFFFMGRMMCRGGDSVARPTANH